MVVVCGPYFKGWFFGRGIERERKREREREREGDSARVAARERWEEVAGPGGEGEGGDGELCRPCKAARSTRGSRATPHDRPLGYIPAFPTP